MSALKKQNKKSKKTSKKNKHVNNKSFTNPPIITDDQKEFYLDQINSLEPRLIRSNGNRALTIIDTYLILKPFVIENPNELYRLVPEYISKEDLLYVNSLLRKISIEEREEKAKSIEQITYELIVSNVNNQDTNDDNDDDNSENTSRSLPTIRCHLINTNEPNKDERIQIWLEESLFIDYDLVLSPGVSSSSLCETSALIVDYNINSIHDESKTSGIFMYE